MGDGRHMTTLPKDSFPGLLRTLVSKIEDEGRGSENLKAGFIKTGLYPFNRVKGLDMLPQETAGGGTGASCNINSDDMSDSLVAFLQHMRHRPNKKAVQRCQKLKVEAGKSVSPDDFESVEESTEGETDEEADVSEMENIDSSSEEEDEEEEEEEEEEEVPNNDILPMRNQSVELEQISEGTWLLVELEMVARNKKKFVGQVTGVFEGSFKMKFVKPYSYGNNNFVWPERADESDVMLTELIQILYMTH